MSRAEKVQRLEAMLVRVLARRDITRIRPQGAPTGPAARPAAPKPSALEALMGPAMDLGSDDLSEVPTSVIRGRASAAVAADVVAAPEPSFRIEGRARAPEPPRAPEPVVAEVTPSIPAPPVVAEVSPSIPAPPPVVAEVAPSIPAPPPVVAEELSVDKATPVPGASELELSDGPEIELSFDEPSPVASPAVEPVVPAPAALIEVPETPVATEAPVAEPEPVAELIEVAPEPVAELIEVAPEPEPIAEPVEAAPVPEPVAELIEVAPEPVAEPVEAAPAIAEVLPVMAATAAVALVTEAPSEAELEAPGERISSVEIEPEELELPVPEAPAVPRTPPPLPPSRPPPDALAEVEVAREVTPEVQRLRESIPAPVEPESLKPPREPSSAPVAVEAARAESFAPAPLPPLPGFVGVIPAVTAERPKTLRGMLDRALSLRPRR